MNLTRPAEALPLLEAALESQARWMGGQLRLPHRLWTLYELQASACWSLGRYPDALQAYLRALPLKPSESPGWPQMLNNLCALAIEYEIPELPQLLERLLAQPEAPLGMFCFEVERRARAQGPEEAEALLRWGLLRCPRLSKDPEAQRLIHSLL